MTLIIQHFDPAMQVAFKQIDETNTNVAKLEH